MVSRRPDIHRLATCYRTEPRIWIRLSACRVVSFPEKVRRVPLVCYLHTTRQSRDSRCVVWESRLLLERIDSRLSCGMPAMIIVLVLASFGIFLRPKNASGYLAVVITLITAAILTNYHSANRARFLHSWLPLLWVVAGVGAAKACQLFVGHLSVLRTIWVHKLR